MATIDSGEEIDLSPASVYEIVTRNMVDRLADDVRDIRDRINGLFWLIAGSVAVDVVIRLTGVGT